MDASGRPSLPTIMVHNASRSNRKVYLWRTRRNAREQVSMNLQLMNEDKI